MGAHARRKRQVAQRMLLVLGLRPGHPQLRSCTSAINVVDRAYRASRHRAQRAVL